MKAKVVKAWHNYWEYLDGREQEASTVKARKSSPCFIVKCPHNWTITARPPRPKASKKKGAKK